MGGRTSLVPLCPALLLAAALAGCAEQAGQEAEASPLITASQAEFGAATGAIDGVALSEDELPVAGAAVGIPELQLETLTDVEGRFTFSNLEPADYGMVWVRLGYQAGSERVTVAAGEAATVTIRLVAVALQVAYKETWTDKGYFECSTRTPISAGPCFFPGPQIPAPNNKRAWNYNVSAGVMTVVNEFEWQPTSLATGSGLRATLSYANRTTTHWYCDAEGFSPLVQRWDRDGGCQTGEGQDPEDGQPTEIPMEGQELRVFVNSGPANPPLDGASTGVTFQQSFDIWGSVFYWEPAPANFTALED